MVRTKIIGLLAVLSVALGCGGLGAGEGNGEEELVLRSYTAPGQADQLEDPIRRVLRLGERRVGSVQVGPGDQLLVLAPRSVHEGLAELIAGQSARATTAVRSSIVMTYWFVAARSGASGAERTGGLEEIESVLEEIVGVEGPREFRLVERLELRQAEGENSTATSPRVKIRQKISISDEGVVAWIEAAPVGPNHIQTQVHLRAGQFLVLGQQALDRSLDPFYWPDGPPRGREAHAERNRPAQTALYVIVRPEVDPLS